MEYISTYIATPHFSDNDLSHYCLLHQLFYCLTLKDKNIEFHGPILYPKQSDY